jgi:hypothetical protein
MLSSRQGVACISPLLTMRVIAAASVVSAAAAAATDIVADTVVQEMKASMAKLPPLPTEKK